MSKLFSDLALMRYPRPPGLCKNSSAAQGYSDRPRVTAMGRALVAEEALKTVPRSYFGLCSLSLL